MNRPPFGTFDDTAQQPPELRAGAASHANDGQTNTTRTFAHFIQRLQERSYLPHIRRLLPWGLLLIIFLVGATLRLYRLAETFEFAPDQGRDATVVWQMIQTHTPVQLGPSSSVGNFKRATAYYYMLIIPFLIGRGEPISGVALNVAFDLATIVLLYLVGRAFFGNWVGLVASSLWSVATLILYFTTFAWHPTLLPAFVLGILLTLREIIAGKTRFVLLLGPLWFLSWQMHDQALFLLPFFGLVWLRFRPRIRFHYYALALGLGLLTMAPFLAYEVQHGFTNVQGMFRVATQAQNSGDVGLLAKMYQHLTKTVRTLDAFLLPAGPSVHRIAEGLVLVGIAWAARLAFRGDRRKKEAQLFVLWLSVPLLYAFWPGPFDPHYLAILFPVPFLLIGLGLDAIRRLHWTVSVVLALGLALLFANEAQTAFAQRRLHGPGRSLTQSLVVERVITSAQGRPFAFKLTSRWEGFEAWDSTYLYLFGLRGHPPVSRADVETYSIYDPQTLRDGPSREGMVVNDVKIVRQEAPSLGRDILANGDFSTQAANWQLPGAAARFVATPQGNALVLVGTDVGDRISATQEFPLEPGKSYLVRFSYRNNLRGASQHVYFQVRSRAGATVAMLPSGGGFVAATSTEWAEGSFLVVIPPDGELGTLWLRNRGIGEAWFRQVEIREVAQEGSR